MCSSDLYGALITYYLKNDPPKPDARVKIQILDSGGQLVRELEGPDRRGYNRVAWDLRYTLTFEAASQDEGWFGPPKGTLVLPGEYKVKLIARGREMTEPVQVRIDPRSRTSPDALKARFEASQKVGELAKAFAAGVRATEGLDREMTAIKDAMKTRSDVAEPLKGRVDALAKEIDKLKGQFRGGFGGPKFQYLDLAGQLQAATAAPTDAQLTTIEHLKVQLTENLTAVNNVITRDLPQLQTDLKSNNISTTGVQPVAMPKFQ